MWYVIIFIAFIAGLAMGVFQTKTIYQKAFERFRDEMYEQYLMLIRRRDIQQKPDELTETRPVHHEIEIPNLHRNPMQ